MELRPSNSIVLLARRGREELARGSKKGGPLVMPVGAFCYNIHSGKLEFRCAARPLYAIRPKQTYMPPKVPKPVVPSACAPNMLPPTYPPAMPVVMPMLVGAAIIGCAIIGCAIIGCATGCGTWTSR